MNSSTNDEVANLFAVDSLAVAFVQVKDQRARRGRRYPLAPVLVLLVLAKLCGADNPKAMAEWVSLRATRLRQWLKLDWRRMPHASTCRRILAQGLDLTEFEATARQFLTGLTQTERKLLNLDGKTLRGTIPPGQTQGLHLLAVQQAETNLVLAQMAVGARENEISVAPSLLQQVALEGKIVTGDALHAQRSLSTQIVAAGGAYLWPVKDNQPTVRAEIATLFRSEPLPDPQTDFRTAQTIDKGHGRIEQRRLTTSSALNDYLDWPHLGQVFALERESYDCRRQQTRREISYGITSLSASEAAPADLLALTRGHWSIENGLHYRRDVTFHEDACRLKSLAAAHSLAILNNLALGLIRTAGWHNVAEARRYYEANVETALGLILDSPT